MPYFRLLKQAYKLTIRYPVLWIFGFFVIGGSNLNFIRFRNLFPVNQPSEMTVLNMVVYLQEHPGWLAMVSSGLLLLSLGGLLLTNWSRIMLVLSVKSLLETKRVELRKANLQSRYLLVPVIKVSLLTTSIMVAVAAAVAVPPLLFTSGYYQTILIVLGAFIFLPLAFTISCINIFTTFFVIIFRKKVPVALNLGTDFFLSRWTHILGIAFLLVIIYSAGFLAGAVAAYLLKLALGMAVGFIPGLGESVVSAILFGIQLLTYLLLWVWLAALNVFINAALLLLFFELITPIKAEQKKAEELVIQPASAA